MKKYILGLCAFFLIVSSTIAGNAPKSFRRHFVIVVDQGACQTHENMLKLCDDLAYLFDNGVLPEGVTQESFADDFDESRTFDFDPTKDEISVFESGITRDDYSRIYNLCRNGELSEEEMNATVVKSLFGKAPSYTEAKAQRELMVTDYFNEYLRPLMNNTSKRRSEIRVGLNEYLYPLVMKRLSLDIPAEEYYILRISNFTSQGAEKAVRQQQLLPMLSNKDKYINGFDTFERSIQSPYYEVPCMKLVRPTSGGTTNHDNTNNNPQVKGGKLGLVKLQGRGLKNMSSPHFTETGYNRRVFTYDNSVVQFTHDSHIKVLQVFLELPGETVDMTDKYHYDPERSNYEFPGGKLSLPDANVDDMINMKYVFYTQSYDDEGTPLLPMVFTNECQYQLSESDFVPKPTGRRDLINGLITAAALALIIFLLAKIRKSRGLKRKASLDFRVIPVSNSRFMEVKGNRVVNEDCWYMGQDNQNQKITVEGQFNVEDKSFSKKYGYRVEYRVEDADSEDDFTFRPDGIDGQGAELEKEEWYRLDIKPDGKFKLNVLTYLDLKHSPDLKDEEVLRKFFADMEHPYRILKMHIKFRILVMDRKKFEQYKEAFQLPNSDNPDDLCAKILPNLGERDMKFEQIYRFIVKPQFERNTGWVAFDPGTTGSCSAFAISGNPFDPNVVTLAKNQFTRTGSDEKITTGIFPSVVKIQDRARCFKASEEEVTGVEEWKQGEDFIFGLSAEQRLGNNRFKSVKKLLGYTNLMEIKNDSVTRKISGKDLALLIVKGLYQNVSDYAMDNPEVDESVRKDMSDTNGRFAPIRAIVAVPNNYTLLKIQDMVDSVKRLGCFEEVHYLYESEGVMMTYLHKMWSSLSEADNHKVFVVYDMGGATINATAFSLDIVFDPHTKNITKITVHTIAKVGYCVGGDDIDYALIRILYDIPSVSAAFGDSDEQKVRNMNANKQKLIQFVTTLKLDLIDKARQVNPDKLRMLANDEMFFNEVCAIMGECGVTLDPNLFTDKDKKYVKSQLENQNKAKSIMTKYVYSKVEDAVGELIADLGSGDMELIFSGRSSLYNHIQEIVKAKIESSGYKPHVWDGFNDADGYLDADKVKTAVAEGACWFALFNTIIRLDHSVITSSFGYIDQEGGKAKFVPVVKRLEKFKDGKMTHKVTPIDVTLNNVKFVQMLGADYDTILHDFYHTKNNRHKINIIDEVRAMSVNGRIENISITIEDNNNFTYDVETSANHITPKTNSYSRLVGHSGSIIKTEIIDENNESYVFAALQSVDEKFDGGGSRSRSTGTRTASSTRSSRATRRADVVEGMESTPPPMGTDEPTSAPEAPSKKGRF